MTDDLLQVVTAQAIELAKLRNELAERRAQYRSILEHNPRPCWVYSFESLRFIDVNDSALATYGWTRDEFLAMTIVDIRPREDVPALLDDLRKMRGAPGGVSGPWRHRHRDGTLAEVEVSFVSLPVDGQAARLIVAVPVARSPRAVTRSQLLLLSRREREVLVLVARGHTSAEIAELLGISPKSVETYRARFTRKLGLDSRAAIVEFAIAHGVLS